MFGVPVVCVKKFRVVGLDECDLWPLQFCFADCHQVAVPDEIDDRWDLEANKSPVVNVFSETSLICSADFRGDLQF